MNDFITALLSSAMIGFLGGSGYFFKRFFQRMDDLIETVGQLVTEVSTLKIRVHFLENKAGVMLREEGKDGD